MKGRKRRMNGLQKEIENRHLPELMRLENGDAVTNCVDWKLRREEIKKLLCHEYMGVTPEISNLHLNVWVRMKMHMVEKQLKKQ